MRVKLTLKSRKHLLRRTSTGDHASYHRLHRSFNDILANNLVEAGCAESDRHHESCSIILRNCGEAQGRFCIPHLSHMLALSEWLTNLERSSH